MLGSISIVLDRLVLAPSGDYCDDCQLDAAGQLILMMMMNMMAMMNKLMSQELLHITWIVFDL